MKPLSVEEAAAFVCVPVSTFRRIAKEHDVPRAKLGKRVVYLDSDLVAMIKNLQTTSVSGLVKQERNTCQSSNAAKYGGAISPSQMERALEEALKPKTSVRRRNFTTN